MLLSSQFLSASIPLQLPHSQVVPLHRQLDQPYRAAHDVPEHLPGGVVEAWAGLGDAAPNALAVAVVVVPTGLNVAKWLQRSSRMLKYRASTILFVQVLAILALVFDQVSANGRGSRFKR